MSNPNEKRPLDESGVPLVAQQNPEQNASYSKQPYPQQSYPQQQYPQQYPPPQYGQQPYQQQPYPGAAAPPGQQSLYPHQQLAAVQYSSAGPEVVVTTPAATGQHRAPLPDSYIGQTVLAALTIFLCFCCCGYICGGIAFYLARMARREAVQGQAAKARSMGRMSYGLSACCLIVGFLVVGLFVLMWVLAIGPFKDAILNWLDELENRNDTLHDDHTHYRSTTTRRPY